MPTSDVTNNSFSTATRLTGINNAPQGRVDQLLDRTTNTLDFYRFTTSGSSNLRINLTGIKGDVQISLYKAPSDTASDAQIEANKIILRPGSTGTLSESYTSTSDTTLADVSAGTYYIKVEQAGIALPESTYSLGVFASTSQATISALWRNPSGGLDAWQMSGNSIDTKGSFSPSDAPLGLQVLGTGDFNADGIDDILWKDSATNKFTIWFMENGTVRQSIAAIQDSTGFDLVKDINWSVIGIDDIDKDGFTDILLRNATSGEVDTWFMYENTVSKVTQLPPGFRVLSDWAVEGFSNSRLLWRNINSNFVATWDLSRNGIEQLRLISFPVSQEWKVVAFQDFNNDGVADVIWRNAQQSVIVSWRMAYANSDPVSLKLYQNIGDNFKISAVADFNGDKRPDILLWDNVNGTVATWEFRTDDLDFDVKIVQSDSKPLKFQSLTFDIALAKDFDGDQKADLLWRDNSANVPTHVTVVWKMDGSVVSSLTILDPVPASSVMPGISYPGYKVNNSVRAVTKKQPQFTAGLTRANAFDLGVLDGSGNFLDAIGGPSNAADRADWYKFKVEIPSLLTGLNLLSTVGGPSIGNAKVEVFTDRGSSSNVAFTAAELLQVFTPDTTTTPGTTLPKTYFIRVTPDPTKQTTRTPYTLNVTGRLGLTDLKANEFTTRETTLALDTNSANNKITVTRLVIENRGDFAANNVSVGYYLSRDGVLDAADRRLTVNTGVGTVARGIAEKVGANGVITPATPNVVTVLASPATITLTLPGKNDSFWSQSGASYQIIAVIDPDKVITNEKEENRPNNAIASSTAFIITGAGGTDLTGTGFTNSTPTISKTGTVSGTFTIQNIGGVPLAAGQSLRVRFYFSTDATISNTNDLVIGTVTINDAIAAGGSLQQNFSFALPTNDDAINYWADNKPANSTQLSGFIGMIIDTTGSNILDANTGNNLNQGLSKDTAALTVTGL
jgi:FG-GAP-like repeat